MNGTVEAMIDRRIPLRARALHDRLSESEALQDQTASFNRTRHQSEDAAAVDFVTASVSSQ